MRNPITSFIVGDSWYTDTGLLVTVERINSAPKTGDTIVFETAVGRQILRTVPQVQDWQRAEIDD